MRLATGQSNESVCAGTMAVRIQNGTPKMSREANDLMQKYGLSHWHFMPVQSYVSALHRKGILGKGKQIECDLPLDKAGTMGFADMLMRCIANREGIGADLAEGLLQGGDELGLAHGRDVGRRLLQGEAITGVGAEFLHRFGACAGQIHHAQRKLVGRSDALVVARDYDLKSCCPGLVVPHIANLDRPGE